jgi:hypothetical protein
MLGYVQQQWAANGAQMARTEKEISHLGIKNNGKIFCKLCFVERHCEDVWGLVWLILDPWVDMIS